jgi:hypothetical protein
VSKLNFHIVIKPNILKDAAKIKDFSRIVGTNPDITVIGGKIVLKGAAKGPFAGKSFNTGLNASDFFNKYNKYDILL